ncbi:MAG: hypothetical protein AABY22_07150 [Nanoarchaeota archaeon]
MFILFALLGAFDCNCGKFIIPSWPFARKVKLVKTFMGWYKSWECPNCKSLWHQEDGYWTRDTKDTYERLKTTTKESIISSFKPDFTSNKDL